MSEGTREIWYVAQTKPKQELRAQANLENQGIEAALPMIMLERIRRGKRVAVREPLFPGYIFVKFSDYAQNFHKIRSTFGVSKLLQFGDSPAQISSQLVSDLLSLDEDSREVKELQRHAVPQVGDKVQILDGPFSGLIAEIVKLDGPSRCIVLVDFLHKQVRAEFDLKSIER
ncbi:transcription/translation regulatory transformer protein RfaH [Pseudidiomarina sp. 1APR75-33.1]|uniref:transcription/translation regulatory transformer protein RfaH n=1 Tax=Pseudidiomarina terrestris TaxID=2820060 RepID=UPI00264CBD8A|nr:transcription/translation regulatory transformer protein RfaH [Pseudidiomarina sp. 1APR75-33.1]MDN7126955.1 transcription/translation regulatory transformer protein RfaH [Pseudidiomarina sp. 1APR75-33.1]